MGILQTIVVAIAIQRCIYRQGSTLAGCLIKCINWERERERERESGREAHIEGAQWGKEVGGRGGGILYMTTKYQHPYADLRVHIEL